VFLLACESFAELILLSVDEYSDADDDDVSVSDPSESDDVVVPASNANQRPTGVCIHCIRHHQCCALVCQIRLTFHPSLHVGLIMHILLLTD
jgi:hypothetical protein